MIIIAAPLRELRNPKDAKSDWYYFSKSLLKALNQNNIELQALEKTSQISNRTNELFNFNNKFKDKSFKDKSLNLLKDEIDSSFKEVAVVNFDRTGGDKNNSREPSLKEVIKNLEQIMYKWKKYMSR